MHLLHLLHCMLVHGARVGGHIHGRGPVEGDRVFALPGSHFGGLEGERLGQEVDRGNGYAQDGERSCCKDNCLGACRRYLFAVKG